MSNDQPSSIPTAIPDAGFTDSIDSPELVVEELSPLPGSISPPWSLQIINNPHSQTVQQPSKHPGLFDEIDKYHRPEPRHIVPLASMSSNVPIGKRIVIIPDHKAVTQAVRAMVKSSGVSHRELAKRLGISYSSIQQYLSGRRMKSPSIEWLARVAAVCDARIVVELAIG